MIENIVSGVIATVICSIFYKLWSIFKNRLTDKTVKNIDMDIRMIRIAKIQFFTCLIYLFLVFISFVFNLLKSDIALTFILVTVFFAFFLCWGAFEHTHKALDNIINNENKQLTNEDSNNN